MKEKRRKQLTIKHTKERTNELYERGKRMKENSKEEI